MPGIRWTQEEDERVREMVARGMTSTAIGAALGRTQRAAKMRIMHLFPGGTGRSAGRPRGDLDAQMAAGVDRRGLDECWEWKGYRYGHGYGQLTNQYESYPAHRVAWEMANGRAIPDGMLVRHTCDNPPCCNPTHLVLGTHADNMRDRDERGRTARIGRPAKA